MLKTTFDPGDPIDYIYKFPPPFAPLEGRIVAEVIGEGALADWVRIKIRRSSFNAGTVEVDVHKSELISRVNIPDPAIRKQRIDRAQKFLYTDIAGDEIVFDDDSNEYYRLDEYWDKWEDEEEDARPSWLYLCKSRQLTFYSAADRIESMVSDCMFEDESTYDLSEWKGVDRLEAAIEEFNNLNQDKIVYYPDYDRIVLMDDPIDG